MNILVLTSTRADYSFYLPLLKGLTSDPFFTVKIVAFGSHLSKNHGYTVSRIEEDGFEVFAKITTNLENDSSKGIALAIGEITKQFAEFWDENKYSVDLVFALGDRFEMFAAVSASIPFNIPIAHFYGGETTLGAIDNVFRHSISLMSHHHFTSATVHSKRVSELVQSTSTVNTIGLLSLENLKEITLYSLKEFEQEWGIDLAKPTILFTFHPETVHLERNIDYAIELSKAFQSLSKSYQVVITMPNIDTANKELRSSFQEVSKANNAVICVESFGMRGYFSAMSHCKLLLGNTSSGITEAASFGKYVINLGDRQKGRTRSKNIIDCPVNANQIIEAVHKTIQLGDFKGENVFSQGNGVSIVIDYLKQL